MPLLDHHLAGRSQGHPDGVVDQGTDRRRAHRDGHRRSHCDRQGADGQRDACRAHADGRRQREGVVGRHLTDPQLAVAEPVGVHGDVEALLRGAGPATGRARPTARALAAPRLDGIDIGSPGITLEHE